MERGGVPYSRDTEEPVIGINGGCDFSAPARHSGDALCVIAPHFAPRSRSQRHGERSEAATTGGAPARSAPERFDGHA
jgi:hypothetical protein